MDLPNDMIYMYVCMYVPSQYDFNGMLYPYCLTNLNTAN